MLASKRFHYSYFQTVTSKPEHQNRNIKMVTLKRLQCNRYTLPPLMLVKVKWNINVKENYLWWTTQACYVWCPCFQLCCRFQYSLFKSVLQLPMFFLNLWHQRQNVLYFFPLVYNFVLKRLSFQKQNFFSYE